jgi:ribosomal protein L5
VIGVPHYLLLRISAIPSPAPPRSSNVAQGDIVISRACYAVCTFGIRRYDKITVHITIRGSKAVDSAGSKLRNTSYDTDFSEAGIQEQIDLEAWYSPDIGITI